MRDLLPQLSFLFIQYYTNGSLRWRQVTEKQCTSCMCMWAAWTWCSRHISVLVLNRKTEQRRQFCCSCRWTSISLHWVCRRHLSCSSSVLSKYNKFITNLHTTYIQVAVSLVVVTLISAGFPKICKVRRYIYLTAVVYTTSTYIYLSTWLPTQCPISLEFGCFRQN